MIAQINDQSIKAIMREYTRWHQGKRTIFAVTKTMHNNHSGIGLGQRGIGLIRNKPATNRQILGAARKLDRFIGVHQIGGGIKSFAAKTSGGIGIFAVT